MELNSLSPYVRLAIHSSLPSNHIIYTRVIYDYELIYVRSGKCRITVDDRTFIAEPGNAVFLTPGVKHSFEVIGSSDFVQPHIHFDMKYSDKSRETPVSFKNTDTMSEYEKSLISENIVPRGLIPPVFTPRNKTEFGRLFFDVIELYAKKSPYCELFMKARMLEIISLILDQFEKKSDSEPSAYAINAVKSYIDSNFRQPITLELLSKQFYVNKYTLLRAFEKHCSVSPIEYCRRLRTEYAKERLKNDRCPVGNIADELCFPDLCAFSRFFRMRTGMSPIEFRKKCEKAEK